MYENKSTKTFAQIMGILTGILGIPHGIAELAQGNTASADIMERIGAFTLIPNYLVTGIVTVVLSTGIIIWSAKYMGHTHGAAMYLLLSVALFFVGGGVAYLVFMLLAWAVGSAIHKPLTFWKKRINPKLRLKYAKLWRPFLISSLVAISSGVSIWLFALPPGELYEITVLHYLCWVLLLLGFASLLCTIIMGFARDIEQQRAD